MVKWHKLNHPQEYATILELMQQRVNDIIKGVKNEIIYSLEHKEIYTAGRLAKKEELLDAQTNIPVIDIGRGGKYTYHGPGQLVVYPLLNLNQNNRVKDLKQYVRNLENIIIASLSRLGLKAYTIDGMVGVWVECNHKPAKIAAIGVRFSRWVASHGLCVNISPDLSRYNAIIPCGIANFTVTSLNRLGIDISVDEFDKIIQHEFAKVFS